MGNRNFRPDLPLSNTGPEEKVMEQIEKEETAHAAAALQDHLLRPVSLRRVRP